MRMPGMNGVQFLAQVRQAAPDTVRIMLTGYADVSAAMDAVKQGNIFRFLAKPCEQEVLSNAITSGLVQYRLVTSEKDLLENTLMGSIKVLTDVLSAVSPEAFGKSIRITRYVRHLVTKFHLPSSWWRTYRVIRMDFPNASGLTALNTSVTTLRSEDHPS